MMRTMRNRPGTAAAFGLIALLSLAGASAAWAGSALNVAYGDVATYRHPEIEAMGGTGAALYRGGFSACFNPAMLDHAAGWRLDAGSSLSQAHEDRFQPLWDSFTSYITDTAIASNRHHYFDDGFAFSGRAARTVAVGASLTTLYDFSYDFSEEVRDPSTTSNPYDTILEERSQGFGGAIRGLTAGASWQPRPDVSIGAAVQYAFGTLTSDRNERFFLLSQSPDSYATTTSQDVDGIHAVVGLRARPGERLELGCSWETPLKVTGDILTTTAMSDSITATSMHGSVRYPNRFRAGFAYFPRTEPRTVFTVDVVYEEWSHLEDALVANPNQNPHLKNTMDVRLGVQHTFYNGVPLRFGFRHLDSYQDREAGLAMFAAGIGIPYRTGAFNFSAELGKMTSYQGHWFPYPDSYLEGTYDVQPTSRVEDTFFRVGAGLTYAF